MMQATIVPYTLQFKQPAGTSRGVYLTRKVWYVVLTSLDNPQHYGIGECAPLPNLSCDDLPDYESILKAACLKLQNTGAIDYNALKTYPSILFGLESALRHYNSESYALWNTSFSRGECGIRINGLIWMGEYKKMLEQISKKLETGFRCIKLKIGAIDFEQELSLLKHIRSTFSND